MKELKSEITEIITTYNIQGGVVDKIAQEVKDIAIEFSHFLDEAIILSYKTDSEMEIDTEKLFDQFIKEKYATP